MFILNGSHYIMVTQASGGSIVVYNRQTIENYGFDDPAELLEKGEWNWTAFKNMLTDFVDNDAGQHRLDGWLNGTAPIPTSGVPPVELKDGKLVSNLYDENLEKAMNFMFDMNKNGLVLDKHLTGWAEHPDYVGQGTELFYIGGSYIIEGAAEVWTEKFGNVEDVMFVPVPKMDGSDKY